MVFTPQQATGKKLGSYELLKEVCASSVGATFIARPGAGGSTVSLTKVHRHVAKSPALCDAFLGAAKRVASLTDDSVERVVDSGTADGEIFVAYEHRDGDTLASLLRRTGPEGLSLPIAGRVILDMIDSVTAAFAANAEFGHGEIGPWCVHIGEDGRARMTGFLVDRALTRFGLHYAKNLDRLPYAAPERVKAMSLTLGPAPPVPDARADCFSIAVIAWELFTRQRLFASRMEAAVIQKVLASAIPDPKSQRAELDEAVSRALLGMLAREPAERTPASDLTSALLKTEVASHEEVAEFASKQVDKQQARGPSSVAPRAFNSVRPPPMAPAVTAPVSKPKPANGTGSLPTPTDAVSKSTPPPPLAPLAGQQRNRAKTLMGFAPAPAVPTPAADAPLEIPVIPPPPAFLTEDTGVTDVMQTTVSSPTAPAASSDRADTSTPARGQRAGVEASSALLQEESTSVDDDLLVEDDEPEPVVSRPPVRRPPPKPRQQTLMGIEPVTQQLAAQAPTMPAVPVRDPSPVAPAVEAKPAHDAGKLNALGLERLGTGAILGKPPETYQLLTAVARGGMATVWAARREGQATLDHLVAIKTMLPELSDDPDFETMFIDEMRVAAKIRHDNVAQILSVGEEDGVMYIVMEWVDGETFGAIQQAARSSGGVPLGILLRMAADICAGLHAAHELKDDAGHLVDLVHRDINPSNVIVGRDGVSKVVDFGIAKSKGRVHVTRAGSTIKGKAPYLSPEQLGGLVIDRRSDLFSLGALLYIMATGVHPFRGESELQTIENIVLKAPAPLRSIVPTIHPDFEKLVLRLLEKEAKKRPANADEVKEELERIGQLVDKSATPADVGEFVVKMVSDVLDARKREMAAASATLSPQASSNGAARTMPMDALELQAAAAAEGISPLPGMDVTPPPFGVEEPTIADPPAEAPLIPQPNFGPPASVDAAASSSDFGAPAVEDDLEQRRPISPWVRLVFLIVVGIAVGIGVIALIEALRSPKADSTPTSTATVTAKATTTSTATAIVTTPQTAMTIDVAPTDSTAPATADTQTAEPTASAPATSPRLPPVAAPPTGPRTAIKPPIGPRPPVSAKPPSSAKKPPPTGSKKPFEPKGI